MQGACYIQKWQASYPSGYVPWSNWIQDVGYGTLLCEKEPKSLGPYFCPYNSTKILRGNAILLQFHLTMFTKIEAFK